jgi:riboflavin kinase/FMN adenylyltransferase
MVYIGTRPTFDGGNRMVEVNLLDFTGDLYTQRLEIEFVAFVRGDQRFDSADALAERMRLDENETRALLGSQRPEGDEPPVAGS